ncbi:hypothetical protein P3S68_033970 [Capsicum galapagoense]
MYRVTKKNVGFVATLQRNARVIMMLCSMLIGSALIFLLANFPVMIKKNEKVEGCTEDVYVPQRVKVVVHAYVLDVKYVVSQAAAARHALISQRLQKLKSPLY